MLRTLLDDVQHEHMTPSAPLEVNIDQRQQQRINEQISKFTALLAHDIFRDAQNHVYQLMYTDSFQRFVKYQLAVAAQRALASSRSRNFFGLGDCFCLTDPTINDNPIVLASDGFVAVTGYTRQEIVPFNCRFLQGELTDPEPVRRIREAVASGQEVTELLVNYRKDGVPFWNLVFIAPLRASDGRIRFFLGGQIDVTSNLNREANINTVIFDDEEPAMSESEEALLSSASSMVQEEYSERGFVTWLKNIFSSKDSATQSQRGGGPTPNRGAGTQTQIGAESNITQMTTMSNQISTFYNTYSKYIVLDPRRASLIFVSWQLLTGLNIPRGVAQTELIGHSLFNTIVGPNTRKSARKNLQTAYREGRAVTEVVVCHERVGVRRAGWGPGESGALIMRVHLTPMKDGVGRVGGFVCVVCVLDDRNVTTQSSSGVADGTMTAASVDIGLIKYPEGEYRGQRGGNPYGGTLSI
ncbi:hypothetical protein BJ742DRAFT_840463 [Cladochytrium replicatum]|nr:hypothetical protein BJ742DRAFT_840463 [Cladochytrium replicatum]